MPRTLRAASLLTWFLVGLPVLMHTPQVPMNFVIWMVAFLILGGSLASPAQNAVHLAVQAACIITMVRLLCNGYEGALLVLIAAQLGLLVTKREGLMWIAVQSAMMFWAIAVHWSMRPAALLTPPYIGFQLLAFFAMQLLAEERRAKQQLAAMHGLAERLRISQELHDALGHHLTALSLNLEVAAHQSEEPARASIRKAQAVARLLLGDVREIVYALNETNGIEVEPALRALISGIPHPAIHLKVPQKLVVAEPQRAHVLVRCAQEIITNAVRHSGASNLWIEVVEKDGRVEVHARDDGKGTDELRSGNGLSGMRGRLAALGGSLHIETHAGLGFEVVALL